MKSIQRLAIGIILGAVSGAGITAWCLKRQIVCEFMNIRGYDLEIAFGHFFDEHISAILISLGIITGAMIVGTAFVSKRWAAILSACVASMVAGIAIMWFVKIKVVDWLVATSEQDRQGQQVFNCLQCLRIIDRSFTNQNSLIQFQTDSRQFLAQYINHAETEKPLYGINPSTNTTYYESAKKYLAAHPLSQRD